MVKFVPRTLECSVCGREYYTFREKCIGCERLNTINTKAEYRVAPVDEVQSFIARNKHQYGYIMSEASRQWIKENPTGALTVGPCNIFIEKYGDYHQLQDKLELYEKVLREIVGYTKYEGNQWYENVKKALPAGIVDERVGFVSYEKIKEAVDSAFKETEK